jgi:hypothetical protein
MDYGISTKKTEVEFTSTNGDFTYKVSYNYDTSGNITGLSCIATETTGGAYLGTLVLADNGCQNINLVSGADLAGHVANFITIVTKIKADVATAVSTTTTTSAS